MRNDPALVISRPGEAGDAESHSTILAPAVTVGLLTFFFTDSFAGGLSGPQGFVAGTVATLAVFALLIVLAYISTRERRHRESFAKIESRLERLSGFLRPLRSTRGMFVTCPSCTEEFVVDLPEKAEAQPHESEQHP